MADTWLITGCSSGIGRGIAKAALEAGYNVVVTARKPETVTEIAADYLDNSLVLALDVSSEESIRSAVADYESLESGRFCYRADDDDVLPAFDGRRQPP